MYNLYNKYIFVHICTSTQTSLHFTSHTWVRFSVANLLSRKQGYETLQIGPASTLVSSRQMSTAFALPRNLSNPVKRSSLKYIQQKRLLKFHEHHSVEKQNEIVSS